MSDPTISIHMIKCVVAKRFGIEVSDIDSGSRRQPIALARQIAMELAFTHFEHIGPTMLAIAFGCFRKSVSYAVETVRFRIKTYEPDRKIYRAICRDLKKAQIIETEAVV